MTRATYLISAHELTPITLFRHDILFLLDDVIDYMRC